MKRVFTAIVLIACVVALILRGQPWMMSAAACLVAELAAYEFVTLANKTGARIPIWWVVAGVAAIFLFTVPEYHYQEAELPLISLLTIVVMAWSAFRGGVERVLPDTALGVFGLIYVAYPLTLLPLLWLRDDGKALLLFLMVCVWAGDTAALYVGKSLGRHKLSALSPNKTWEGSIGSVAGSVIAGLAIVYAGDALLARGSTLLHIVEPVWQAALLAVLINVAAQLGDLLESAIKRGAGVKDSGTMLPGHGGILDRIDALLLAAPALWVVLLIKDAVSLGRF
ncbi:MAG TPA: phosphatidate cytidylyltransferase [Acidobacteriaceae bacterium]|nr:phosphatidate cytidylyltransferase [Acidobacteriaceae bacterium]